MLDLLRRLDDPQQQRAVINADDESFAAAAAAASAVPRITYGIDNPIADVRAESISMTLWETTVSLLLQHRQCGCACIAALRPCSDMVPSLL
jgi:UDP-N-acetylmuramate-alanine ligase